MLLLITNPRFRLLWTNYTIAGLSGFMYMMVHQWLTLEITDSPFWVGAVAGVSGVAFMFVSIAGGVLAEILDTTPESDAYQRGEYQKCRYCFNL